MKPLKLVLGLLVFWILYRCYQSYVEVQRKEAALAKRPVVGSWDAIGSTSRIQFPWYKRMIPWWISSPFFSYYGYRNSKDHQYAYWANTPFYKHYWYRPHYIGHGYQSQYADKSFHHYHQPHKA